jgi:hypothetical protein
MNEEYLQQLEIDVEAIRLVIHEEEQRRIPNAQNAEATAIEKTRNDGETHAG